MGGRIAGDTTPQRPSILRCTAIITVYDEGASVLFACERHSGHNGKHVARMGGNAIHAVGGGRKGYYSIAKVTWL